MRTTLLNPTVWLLVALCVAGAIGAVARAHRASLSRLTPACGIRVAGT